MFVRFRQSKTRLQLSLVETCRVNGKVRHEHIASLGSIKLPLTMTLRVAYWSTLHQRLARLANRVNGELQASILGAVHARIPRITVDEIRQLQRENAEADAKTWETLRDNAESQITNQRALIAAAETAVANAEEAKKAAENVAETYRRRIKRLEQGEPVAGSLKRDLTRKELLKLTGMTETDAKYAAASNWLGENGVSIEEIAAEEMKNHKPRHRAAIRKLVRKVLERQSAT